MNEPAKHGAPFSHPPDDPLRISRVSIADLLLITLGTAIVIWFWLPLEGKLNRSETAVTIAFAPLYGSAIAAVLIALFRAHRILPPFPTQPGHWLLLLVGVTFVAVGLLAKATDLESSNAPRGEIWKFWQVVCILAVGFLFLFSAGMLFTVAFGVVEESARWRWFFQLTAALIVTLFFGGCCVDPLGSPPMLFLLAIPLVGLFILILVAAVAAIVEDRLHRLPRDFWHWLGLAAFFGIPLHFVVLVIVARYAR
jgi:hypothetical protein